MGILSVVEKFGGHRSSTIDRTYRRVYTRKFVVETTSPLVGALAVRSALAVPQLGTWYTNGLAGTDPDYEYDQGSFVNSIEASEDSDGGGIQWTVTVQYEPFDTSQFGPDPTLWPIKVSFGGDRTEKVIYFDKNGDPIRNSALDPFDPPVVIDDSRTTMVVTRNELVSAFDPTLAESYRDKINDAVWNGFAARTVKLGIITTSDPQSASIGGAAPVYYYTVTYPLTIDRNTWRKSLLDQGLNELDGSTPAKPKAITNNGVAITEPVPLDGSGQRLASTGTPVTLTKDVYDEVDFGGLNINLSLRLGA